MTSQFHTIFFAKILLFNLLDKSFDLTWSQSCDCLIAFLPLCMVCKKILCFKLKLRKFVKWNCFLGPSIRPRQQTNWQYHLMNYLLARNHGKFHSGNDDLMGGYCNEILVFSWSLERVLQFPWYKFRNSLEYLESLHQFDLQSRNAQFQRDSLPESSNLVNETIYFCPNFKANFW